MNQKVKLQISSDVEDVTKVSSVLLDEALLHIRDLAGMITASKDLLKELNIRNPEDMQKLQNAFELINTTRLPLSKIDNRLGDIVAVLDGLVRVLTEKPEEQKTEQVNDSVTSG